MKYLAICFLFLVACATTTPEELDRQAMACMNSLVQDEKGSIRSRTPEEIRRDCGELFDKRDEAVQKRLDKERYQYPVCPGNKIAVCQGPSCGRPPRHERDYDDYKCASRDDWKILLF